MSVEKHFVERMNELGGERVPFLFMIDYAMQRPLVLPLAEIDPRELLYNIKGNTNADKVKWTGRVHGGRRYGGSPGDADQQQPLPHKILFQKKPVTLEHYAKAFNHVMQHLLAGNSFLVNLTLPTLLETNLTLQQIFFNSHADYKLWYHDHFVVFSPETFITIGRGSPPGVATPGHSAHQGKINAHPMKGTIDSAVPDAEQRLLNDPKELAEHVTIVDLIRNDMSMIASAVTVEKFRYIDHITTHEGKELLQASTKISGKLPEGYLEKLGTIIAAMLPAGSISGAPKPKTLQIIREAEKYERGYYTGIVGIFDGECLDSGVMIRFIEQQGGRFYFKSGGGITARSNMQSEYQELIDKVYVPIK